jgi:hypothetical protein
MSNTDILHEKIVEREGLLAILELFKEEHQSVLVQIEEFEGSLKELEADICALAAAGSEKEIVDSHTKVKVIWRSASKTYDAEKLCAAWPAADEQPGLIKRSVDTTLARELAKVGTIPMEAIQAALVIGAEPKPTVKIEDLND